MVRAVTIGGAALAMMLSGLGTAASATAEPAPGATV
jgi:hypothetical protein